MSIRRLSGTGIDSRILTPPPILGAVTGIYLPSVVNGWALTKWTGNGTVTPAVGGLARVLVAGGGGGCGSDSGGGAGGYIDTYILLEAGRTYAITVGLGGAAAVSTSALGSPGAASKFEWLHALGGGGGGSALAVGSSGGSAGGSSRVGGVTTADVSYGRQGYGQSTSGGAGAGGAGGPSTGAAGGPGVLWIDDRLYCVGGTITTTPSPSANTGNGGSGSWAAVNAGDSGVVILAIAA